MMASASRIAANRPIGESKKAFSSKSASRAVNLSDMMPSSAVHGAKSLNPQNPLDFDHFIPWIVKELNGSKLVVVKRSLQDDYFHKGGDKRVRFVQTQKGSINFSTISTATVKTFVAVPPDFENEDAIILTATYDHNGRLVEIAFIDCILPLNRQVMKVISLCLPFHAMLTKLTIKEKRLNCGILYEIAKFLPFSNLTDICLDSSYVRQGNYYILLDQTSSLKCLSLSNCNISDIVCREIAERIEFQRPASKNLLVLNLSYNKITDLGAEALGRSLRTNRRLLHLNLCNNKLSAVGAEHILVHLSKFQLTATEVMEMKRQGIEYFQTKAAVIEKCLKQIRLNRLPARSEASRRRSQLAKRQTLMGEVKGSSDYENAEMMALGIVGPFEYAFTSQNTVFKDGHRFCIGNFTLCSLNLGYNNLDFFNITKIVDILSYQSSLMHSRGTGLMRLVIEGNNLPESCTEYTLIKTYLQLVTDHYMPRTHQVSKKLSEDSMAVLKPSKPVGSQVKKRGFKA
ncbi:hypothetical protein MSG28_011775 [Choristoneura fumiferana]|uniref:Uncharacterized protein n=1 Tax=Choristoneura fumiferana TaxID=7141 RepID=A0ACC0KLQ3_CHOFU|nr:hypothetical protein MSG28_011775 [Choristoneura fumiferana]